MVATLNYDLKNAPVDLWEGSRWTVLTMLILHANIRNRCWTSIDYLADKLGKSTATIESALKWLRKVGALEVVPYKERVDDEKKLPNRQHIYQLTGKLSDGAKSTEYLYVSPVNGQVLETETSDGKVSETKTSGQEGHVLKTKSFKKQNLTDPTIGSTESSKNKGTGVPSPAPEPDQPINPESKRESVEPEPAVKERIAKPKEKSSAKKEKMSIPPPSDDTMYELARLCYGSVDALKVNGNYGYLRKIYNDLYPAWGQMTKADVIFFERRWYQFDWRGKQRERPTPALVRSEWYNLMNKEPRYVKQTTAPASVANPAETGQAVPDQSERTVHRETAETSGTSTALLGNLVSAAEWKRRVSEVPGNKVGEGSDGQG